MNKIITMLGKPIDVHLSERATNNLEKRTKILCLEMELYFSCMNRWAGSPSAEIAGTQRNDRWAGSPSAEIAPQEYFLRGAWTQKNDRKQVRFLESMNTKLVAPIGKNLVIGFRTVMTEACKLSSTDVKPSLTDLPIKKTENYIPNWLKIDFQNDEWCGEFGY